MIALRRYRTHLLGILLWMALAGLIRLVCVQPVMAQASLQVIETEGSTAVVEGGSADTYTLSLAVEPTGPVTVTATPGSARIDLGNGPGAVVDHVFPVETWSEPWQVGVTAPDNDVTDGPEQVTVEHVAAGGGYGGVTVGVTVSVQDDEAVGNGPADAQVTLDPASSSDPAYDGSTLFLPEVIISPDQIEVAEGGLSFSYALVLGSEPLPLPDETVTVTATAPSPRIRLNGGSGEVTRTFTAENWDEPQSIAVQAVDNDVDDGIETVAVSHSAEGGGYDGVVIDPLMVTVRDNDTAGVIVTPQTLLVTEGDTTSYDVVLSSQPPEEEGSVYVSAMTAGGRLVFVGAGSAGRADLEFTHSTWDEPQTVTVRAVDNDLAEGQQTVTIAHSVSGDGYEDVSVPSVTLTIADDDVADIEVSPTSLTVSEPDGDATFTILLSSQPLDDVVVPVSVNSPRIQVTPATVTLTGDNWSTGAAVTVQAVDDQVVNGTAIAQVTLGPAVSADPAYDDQTVSSVTVGVEDDDEVGVVVTPQQVSVVEGGAPDTYTLALTSQPTGDVAIRAQLQSPEALLVGAGPGGVVTRTFTPQNWSTPQSIAVLAIDDALLDGHTTATITHAVVATNEYQGASVPSVAVSVADNDTADVSVGPLALTLLEGGDPGAYTLTLTARPTTTVSIDVVPDDGLDVGNGPGEALQFSIPPAEWQTPWPVTVSAVDNDVADGTRDAWISHTATGGGYSGVDIESVRVGIQDDEVPGIVLSATELVISSDEPAELTITLATRPSAWVRIPLSVTGGACNVLPSSVDLGPPTWSEGAAVSVHTTADRADAAGGECTVRVGPAMSIDPRYNGLSAPNVRVTIEPGDRHGSIALPLLLLRWPPVAGGPTLLPIENPEGDGEYTIAWSVVPETEAYLLEEASGPAFADASVVYEGPEPQVTITGRGAGRRWYRVRSRSTWGVVGPWSAAVHADVVWEREPNDSALQGANGPLVANIGYRGRADSAADAQDYFYLVLSEPTALDLRLTGISAGNNSDLVLRDADLTLIAYSGELGAADEQIATGLLSPGLYYVQVYHRSYGGGAGAYTLTLSTR